LAVPRREAGSKAAGQWHGAGWRELFAVYDAGLRQMIVVNAGAPRPVLMRGAKIQEVKIEGTPVGMFPGIEYETITLALEPDDIIVFASDGILEAMNADDQPFGFGRLAGVLRNLAPGSSAESISAAILDATDEFSGRPIEAHDDRTLIILRLTGNRDGKQAGNAA
jgi:sigma-B regulation protein RsbU (phosphoserine phosphatase)